MSILSRSVDLSPQGGGPGIGLPFGVFEGLSPWLRILVVSKRRQSAGLDATCHPLIYSVLFGKWQSVSSSGDSSCWSCLP